MAQMRSRREQVDAHRFITSRMNQALVLANPDSVERPLRRIGVSIFASVMIMVLIFGGFTIAALLNKGNDSPEPNHIIFEKGTQAIFVYTTMSGGAPTDTDPLKLWPVANYTSALLLLQPYQGDPPVQTLKPESLEEIPRGFPVGIEGAPFSPPPPSSLLQSELWNVCSMPVRDGSNMLLAQVVVAKPKDLPAPEALGEDWLIARTLENETFLLTNDRRFKITDDGAFDKLGQSQNDVVTVKKEIIETITPGPELAVGPREEFGEPSEVEASGGQILNYGQTVVVNGENYVLIREDGEPEFAPSGEVMNRLLEPETEDGVTIEISSQLLTQHGAQGEYEPSHFPGAVDREPRTLSGTRPGVCTTFDPGAEGADAHMSIGVYDSTPSMLNSSAESVDMQDGEIIATGDPVANTVLPPGHAALVSPQQQPGSTIASVTYLIDSLGYKFGIQDSGVAHGQTKGLLGYGEVEPVGVPESVLGLIQTGTVLDPVDARSELDPSGEYQPSFDSGEDEEGEGGEDAGEE